MDKLVYRTNTDVGRMNGWSKRANVRTPGQKDEHTEKRAHGCKDGRLTIQTYCILNILQKLDGSARRQTLYVEYFQKNETCWELFIATVFIIKWCVDYDASNLIISDFSGMWDLSKGNSLSKLLTDEIAVHMQYRPIKYVWVNNDIFNGPALRFL